MRSGASIDGKVASYQGCGPGLIVLNYRSQSHFLAFHFESCPVLVINYCMHAMTPKLYMTDHLSFIFLFVLFSFFFLPSYLSSSIELIHSNCQQLHVQLALQIPTMLCFETYTYCDRSSLLAVCP